MLERVFHDEMPNPYTSDLNICHVKVMEEVEQWFPVEQGKLSIRKDLLKEVWFEVAFEDAQGFHHVEKNTPETSLVQFICPLRPHSNSTDIKEWIQETSWNFLVQRSGYYVVTCWRHGHGAC